ncbi:MAG: hypothetical protein M3Y03_06655 [Verrucomicrobiota bacterium]|nr:hypothetical protein [Verrucomicrobiota bacterium]
MSLPTISAELAALENGTLDPAKFPHREHLRFAYEMLGQHSLGEAIMRFSRGVRQLAGKVGQPQLYHETITLGFLAVIAERRARAAHKDWSDFIAQNPDLLDKQALLRWYPVAQLDSELARRTFCLPTPRVEAFPG